MPEKRWRVRVTLIERGRLAIVEAPTRAEAIKRARRGDWVEALDPETWEVRTNGPAVEDE